MRPEKLEVFLMVGGNPIISKQYFPQNPGQQLKRFIKNGMKLIVIDPRRTETARRAHVHLQCIPGEDPSIIAGLIHLVIKNGFVNQKFVDLNAEDSTNCGRPPAPLRPSTLRRVLASISKHCERPLASSVKQRLGTSAPGSAQRWQRAAR